jgi:hypothetical protein
MAFHDRAVPSEIDYMLELRTVPDKANPPTPPAAHPGVKHLSDWRIHGAGSLARALVSNRVNLSFFAH